MSHTTSAAATTPTKDAAARESLHVHVVALPPGASESTEDLERGGVVVEVTWNGTEVPPTWRLPGPVAESFSVQMLQDAEGPIAAEPTRDGAGGLLLQLPEDASPPVRLRYRLAALPPPDGQLAVSPEGITARGPALLWLPDLSTPRPVTLSVEAPRGWTVASSLGLGPIAQHSISPRVLQRIDLLMGPLGWAELETLEGHDYAALLGPTSYDFRWVAAETAGVRSSVDEYFGGATVDAFTTLVTSRSRPPFSPPAAVELGPSSMLLDVDSTAPWNAATRMPVAQALVHRWLGGALSLDMGPNARPGEEVWFTQGFSRHVARSLLFELGTLSIGEWLDELAAMEAVLATSDLRHLSNAELVADGSPEAVRVVMARGASYAARLDAVIRAEQASGAGLRKLLGDLLHRARTQRQRTLPLAQFEDALGSWAGADEVAAFRAQVLQGRPVAIPAHAFGPCFIRGRGRYTAFALGLSEVELATARPVLEQVDPDGPAHAAGVRPGDELVHLDLRWGDPSVAAAAMVLRNDEMLTFTWMPRGQTHPGRRWRHNEAVPDHACVLPEN